MASSDPQALRIAGEVRKARTYFSAGDGLEKLERIFDCGEISQDAYDFLYAECEQEGCVLTQQQADDADLSCGGLLDLPDDLVSRVMAQADAFNARASRGSRQIGDHLPHGWEAR